MTMPIHDLEELETLPDTKKLVRFKDERGWRWYSHPEDTKSPEKWYTSVTAVIGIVVADRLKDYLSSVDGNVQKARLEKAVASGNSIHEAIQNDLMGKPWNAADPSLIAPMGKWSEIRQAHRVSADYCELSVYSPTWGYAGTIDILGRYDDKMTILDIKTGFFSTKAGFQMGAYRAALAELTGEERGMVGLSIKADGSKANVFEYSHYDWCLLTFHSNFQSWKGLYYSRLAAMNWKYLHTTPLSVQP